MGFSGLGIGRAACNGLAEFDGSLLQDWKADI
jgi:hypothetical protein